MGERFRRFLEARPELRQYIHDPMKTGFAGRRLAAVLNEEKLRRVLASLLNEDDFLTPLWHPFPQHQSRRASFCVPSGGPGSIGFRTYRRSRTRASFG
jgi:hypothetical protein